MTDLGRAAFGALRPLMFRLGGGDAEEAHKWVLQRLSKLDSSPRALAATRRVLGQYDDPVTVFGVRFPNRVGLAAGMAKNGEALRAWAALGFGFVELGTVTWRSQPGNPRPRLFRLKGSKAIINRMGFNNYGAQSLAARLQTYGATATQVADSVGLPVGVSLGKSKSTGLEHAVGDYVSSMRAVRRYASYVAVNVSSPNTPGLRSLQDRDVLVELLAALKAEAAEVPVLVKIAPDLTDQAIGDVLQVCHDQHIDGIIATNTTTGRDGLAASDQHLAGEAGGLSGPPLRARSLEVVRLIHAESGGALPVIGVGGISSPDDAAAMLDAGASLVQLYTAFIYQGPPLVRAIAARLATTAGAQ